MKMFQRFIYGRDPRTAIIKQKAHLFTLLAVLWSGFSLIAVIFFQDLHEHTDGLGWLAALGIWGVHLAWVLLAVCFWITEKPKPVLMPDTGDGDADIS